ncbi:hypothetical protein EUTSA_v10021497mg [Eutrema salsugineum]|uniref:Uncharacterized protein n=1 Tax=Eutrema salsugineum TaxID=72664 RepID=V4M2J2_EUTSA|nr:uncharacterized protein LOC18023432 [Eutrema salsugineum]ESQ49027.1 hypothetical protein EUTSA_v10021497mg [Eutrema salsugineum]
MSISSLGFANSRPTSSSSSSSFRKLVSSRIFGLPTSSLLWAKNKPHHTNTALKQIQKQKLCVRNSAQEIPQQLEEDSKFVPLDPQDPLFGPPVLLLLGFQFHETHKIQELLKELDGEFMKIVLCTEDMIPRSLWEAVNTRQTDLKRVKIAESLPRICFLSGLTGEEMMMFIEAFPETGLEPAVFAAMVPNSADKPISELMEEIMGDHEMLTGSGSS